MNSFTAPRIQTAPASISSQGLETPLDTGRSYFTSTECSPRVDDFDVPKSTVKFGDLFGTRSDYSKGTFYRGKKIFLSDNMFATTNKETSTDIDCESPNMLKPPDMFMTRKQIRKHKTISNLSHFKKLDFNVVKEDGDLKAMKAAMIRRQEGQLKKKKTPSTFTLDPYSSYQKKDWTLKFQAGCYFYVNENTGEVSAEPPWTLCRHDAPESSRIEQRKGSSLVNKLRTTVIVNNLGGADHHPTMSSAVKGLVASGRHSPSSLPDATPTGGRSSLLNDDGTLPHVPENTTDGDIVLDPEQEGTGSIVYDHAPMEEFFNILDSAAEADRKRPNTTPNLRGNKVRHK